MAPKAASEKPARKTKSSGGGGKKRKLSAFNKFMQTELARLKEADPDVAHQDRFKAAAENWRKSKDNPKNA